jgi:hypothetical protein
MRTPDAVVYEVDEELRAREGRDERLLEHTTVRLKVACQAN